MTAVQLTPALRDALRKRGFFMDGNFTGAALSPDLCIETPASTNALLGLDYPLRIGAFSHLNGGFIQNATIGRYCSLARDVQIGHGRHPVDWLSVSPLQYSPGYRGWQNAAGLPPMPSTSLFKWETHTVVGSDVWLGNGVFVQDGVHIGHGAIVGARSVVTRDVPPYAVVAGNPARLIRMRFPEDIVRRLLATQWWKYALSDFGAVDYSNIHATLGRIESQLADGSLRELTPATIDADMLRAWAPSSRVHVGLDTGMQEKIRSLKNSKKGKTAYILGNGPSLNDLDVRTLLQKESFWCNRAWELTRKYPDLHFAPKYYFVADPQAFDQYPEDIMAVPAGIKFLRADVEQKARIAHAESLDRQNVITFPLTESPYMDEGYFSHDPAHAIFRGFTVVLNAAQFAFYMGYEKVLIGGVDLDYSQPYFFGERSAGDMPVDRAAESFRVARHFFEQHGRLLAKITASPKLPLEYVNPANFSTEVTDE